jgi:hypothetical protein
MRRIAMLVVALALLAAPASALAQASSTCNAYNAETCGPQQITRGNTSGQLPFTGLDVVLLVVGGGTLLGAGFIVRRASKHLG